MKERMTKDRTAHYFEGAAIGMALTVMLYLGMKIMDPYYEYNWIFSMVIAIAACAVTAINLHKKEKKNIEKDVWGDST